MKIFIFGCRNYVVQFILELKIPSASSKLTYQFEGNYVNLSRQKFSSHVVEKCLVACNNEVKSKIIHELLSTPYFDQLLQDPHANYVIQKALQVSEVRTYLVFCTNHNDPLPSTFHRSFATRAHYMIRWLMQSSPTNSSLGIVLIPRGFSLTRFWRGESRSTISMLFCVWKRSQFFCQFWPPKMFCCIHGLLLQMSVKERANTELHFVVNVPWGRLFCMLCSWDVYLMSVYICRIAFCRCSIASFYFWDNNRNSSWYMKMCTR